MGQWVGSQGQVKVAKKNAKTPPLVTFPPENAKPKTNKFFFNVN